MTCLFESQLKYEQNDLTDVKPSITKYQQQGLESVQPRVSEGSGFVGCEPTVRYHGAKLDIPGAIEDKNGLGLEHQAKPYCPEREDPKSTK